MPRSLRIHLVNGFYHVTLRGNHREPIFRVDADRGLLNAVVARALEKYDARIHAYCWMTNHLHFLLQVSEQPLGAVMRHIACNYARAFQRKIQTSGHLFERRYHARLVSADQYLLVLLRYIHLNPVQAGLVRSVADYRWSSHRAYAGCCSDAWLTTDFALSLFARERYRAQLAYRRFLAAGDPGWVPEDAPTALETALQPKPAIVRKLDVAEGLSQPQSLESLIEEACELFGVDGRQLRSISREKAVVQARAWVGREAVIRGVASLSEVARALGRDRATLRYAMRRLAVAFKV